MSANDDLRAELRKRGVKYDIRDSKDMKKTHESTYWNDLDGRRWGYVSGEGGAIKDCRLVLVRGCRDFTPAQAIELTLGRGTCVPILNSERDCRPYLSLWFVCSECGCRLTENRLGKVWQKFCPNCGRRIVEVDE